MKLTFVLLFSFISYASFSQQINHSSIAINKKFLSIASYGGLRNQTLVGLSYRSQWNDFAKTPRSFQFFVHTPVVNKSNAIGLFVEKLSEGLIEKTKARLSYNRISSFRFGIVSLGLGALLNQIDIDGSLIRTPRGQYKDNSISHKDNFLNTKVNSARFLDFEWSFLFANKYVDIAGTFSNVLQKKLKIGDIEYKKSANILLFTQYKFLIGSRYKSTFYVYGYTDLKEMQLQYGLQMWSNSNWVSGIGLRGYSEHSIDALIAMFGWRFDKNIKINYGIDIGISNLKKAYTNSHEIVLTYNFDNVPLIGKRPIRTNHPRYM